MTDQKYPEMGSFVVVQTHGVVPWLIRKGTHSWADHVFVMYNNDGGLVEAEPGGVGLAHISKYDGMRMLSCTEGTLQQRADVAAAALGMVGRGYGDLDIADLGLEALGVRWRWLAKAVDRSHGVICSQMAAMCGRIGALDWSCGQSDLAQVVPGMMAQYAEQRLSIAAR